MDKLHEVLILLKGPESYWAVWPTTVVKVVWEEGNSIITKGFRKFPT